MTRGHNKCSICGHNIKRNESIDEHYLKHNEFYGKSGSKNIRGKRK